MRYVCNRKHDGRREVLRLIATLSPAERVLWRSMKGYVPIGLRRAFEQSARDEARAEEFSNFHQPAAPAAPTERMEL